MIESFLNTPDVAIVIVGMFVGAASSLLGTFLVLRKASMLSDAISHSILLGIIVVYLITRNQFSPFFVVGAALAGVLTVALVELLVTSKRLKDDAAIGIVYPFLFAVAVILINVFARNVHIDTDAVLLGEIGFVWLDVKPFLGLDLPAAMVNMGIILTLNALFVTLFYKELKLATFDPALAAALGLSPSIIYGALLFLLSMTAVTAFDAVGSVLLVAFVIVPPATAYLLTDRLGWMLGYGVMSALLSSVLGYVSAVVLNVSIGGMMACWTGVLFVAVLLLSPRYGVMAQGVRQQNQQMRLAQRTLAVHLYNHEKGGHEDEESLEEVLESHLRWKPNRANRVVVSSLDEGLITVSKHQLVLTPRGRLLAQEVLEPWQKA